MRTDARAAAIIDRVRRHGARGVGAAARHRPFARGAGRRTADADGAVAVVGPGRRRRGRPVDRHRPRRRRRGRDRAPACGLRPSRRADAHDMFLAGQIATVAGVFHDVDGERPRRRDARRRPRPRSCSSGTAATCTSIPTRSRCSRTRRSPSRRGRAVKVLVAGIGNIFLGDDGFGVEVAQRLVAERPAATACASRTSASAACTSPTSCSTATTRSSSSTRCSIGEPPGTVAVIEPDRSDSATRATTTHRRSTPTA